MELLYCTGSFRSRDIAALSLDEPKSTATDRPAFKPT